MTGWRTFKVFLYVSVGCVSLYSVSRLIEPMLALANGDLSAFGGSEAAQGALNRLVDQVAQTQGLTAAQSEMPGAGDRNERSGIDSLLSSALGAPASPGESSGGNELPAAVHKPEGLSKEEAQAMFDSAVSLHAQGRLDEAIVAYHNLLSRSDDAGVHLNLAVAYFQQGDYHGAQQEVEEARRLGREARPEFIAALEKKLPLARQ
ncbi:MAG: tetratricopeptide repeat protein [Phycisphaerales bacterium]